MKFFYFFIFCSTLFACKTPASIISTATEKKANQIGFDNILKSQQLQKGVDFFASGNTPTPWRLQIDVDDTCTFIADDGLNLKLAYKH